MKTETAYYNEKGEIEGYQCFVNNMFVGIKCKFDNWKFHPVKYKHEVEEADKYREAFNLLMEYWDCLPEEERVDIDKRLKELGV